MTVYERIECLRKSRGLSQGKLEKELGFSNGSVSKWKNSMPTMERLQKIADFFEISLDYLITGKDQNLVKGPVLNQKDERDIKKDLENLREKLANKEFGPAAFDGDDIPDDDTDLFLGQVELMLRRLKVKNKEKYNPHKNTK